jgi:MSHA pilin protein MshC
MEVLLVWQQRANHGFTLVELVTVIILVGILSVVVAGKFFGRGGFDEYTYRDRLLAALRLVQLNAMNDRAGSCHQLLIEASRFGAPDSDPCTASQSYSSDYFAATKQPNRSALLPSEIRHEVSLSSGLPVDIRFDGFGRPLLSCRGGCQLRVVGEVTLGICIEVEGFIHAC